MAVRPKGDAETVPEQSVESSAAGIEWAAIMAGALAAVGVSIILFASAQDSASPGPVPGRSPRGG